MKRILILMSILTVCLLWSASTLLAKSANNGATEVGQWQPVTAEVFETVNLNDNPELYSQATPNLEQMQEEMLSRVNRPGPVVKGDQTAYVPLSYLGPEMPDPSPLPAKDEIPTPPAQGTFQTYFLHQFTTSELPSVSNVAEPSVSFAQAKKGFFTVNWSAARTNGATSGSSWLYVNPYTPAIPTGYTFCCDQETVFDPVYNLTIWMRLLLNNNGVGGALSLGVSKNGASFTFYTLYASSTLVPDFPHMTLSHNYLYISFNEFNSVGFTRSVVSRWPLIEMARTVGTIHGGEFSRTDWFTIMMAKNHGHNSTMFGVSNWPGTTPRNRVAIFRLPESSNSYSTNVVSVNAWGYYTGGGSFSCPLTDGTNPCLRADDRVLGAVASFNNKFNDPPQNSGDPLDQLWVSWNSGPYGGITVPYTYLVKINLANNTVIRYDPIYNTTDYVWFYVRMAPNAFGDIGTVGDRFNMVSSSGRTIFWSGIRDNDITGYYAPFTWYVIGSGSNGPPDNKWGDYNDINPWWRNQAQFVAAGHVRSSTRSVPYYVRMTNSSNFP